MVFGVGHGVSIGSETSGGMDNITLRNLTMIGTVSDKTSLALSLPLTLPPLPPPHLSLENVHGHAQEDTLIMYIVYQRVLLRQHPARCMLTCVRY